jgi:drug/metabolite transporter (DMT)-like permease
MSDKIRGLLAGLTAAAIWGGMYVVSKVTLEVIPPFTLLSLRLGLGAAALGLVWWRTGGTGLTRRNASASLPSLSFRAGLPEALALGLLGYGVSLGLQFVGTRLSTASNGAVITSATPAFVFLFARWLLWERVSRRRAAALAVATLGVLLVVDVRAAELAPGMFRGNLALAGAAVSWAWYSALVRRAARRMAVLPMTIAAFLGGLAVAVPGAVCELRTEGVGELTPGIWLGVLYLGLVSTAAAAYLWNKAFELLEAGPASLTFFAQPLVGAALGALLLGERLSGGFLAGAALIGAGVWLAAATPAGVES